MNRARWMVQYHQRVLASDPFSYWIEDEKQGAVAYDRVSGRALGAQNGTHVGVTLGQPGIGDGRTSPFYDGVNDYTNIATAAFLAAFDGDEGTVLIWARVANAGVWADGLVRRAVYIISPAFVDRVVISKRAFPNSLVWNYFAGGVNLTRNDAAATTTTDWMSLAMTWSAAADEMRAYFNGVQVGAPLNGLGVWGAAPATALIGAASAVPAEPWHGYEDHCALWNRALPPAEIADLGVPE